MIELRALGNTYSKIDVELGVKNGISYYAIKKYAEMQEV